MASEGPCQAGVCEVSSPVTQPGGCLWTHCRFLSAFNRRNGVFNTYDQSYFSQTQKQVFIFLPWSNLYFLLFTSFQRLFVMLEISTYVWTGGLQEGSMSPEMRIALNMTFPLRLVAQRFHSTFWCFVLCFKADLSSRLAAEQARCVRTPSRRQLCLGRKPWFLSCSGW